MLKYRCTSVTLRKYFLFFRKLKGPLYFYEAMERKGKGQGINVKFSVLYFLQSLPILAWSETICAKRFWIFAARSFSRKHGILKTRTSTDFKPKPAEPAVDFLLKIVQEKYLEKYSCPFCQGGNGKEICPFWLTGNVKHRFPKIKNFSTCLLQSNLVPH